MGFFGRVAASNKCNTKLDFTSPLDSSDFQFLIWLFDSKLCFFSVR